MTARTGYLLATFASVTTLLTLSACSLFINREIVQEYRFGMYSPAPTIGPDGTMYTTGYFLSLVLGTPAHTDIGCIDARTGECAVIARFDGGVSPFVVTRDSDALFVQGACLVSMDRAGSERWRLDLADRTYSPALALSRSGVIYLISDDGSAIHYLSAASLDGALQWSTALDAEYNSLAIGTDETLYLAGTHLSAFTHDGAQIWREQLTAGTDHVSLGNGFIAMPMHNLGVVAYDMDGTKLWELPESFLPSNGFEPAIGRDGTIYISALYSLFAIAGGTGEVKWSLDYDCSEVSIGSDGNLYAICYFDELNLGIESAKEWYFVSIDADRGEILWYENCNYPLGANAYFVNGPPAFYGGSAYFGVGSYSSAVYCLDGMPKLDVSSPWPRARGNNANTGQANR